MSEHHVETWLDDRQSWGWQCFTCHDETVGFPSLATAEEAGTRHSRGEEPAGFVCVLPNAPR